MIKCILVRYPFMPIACEGDDDDNTMQSIEVKLKSSSRVDDMMNALEKRMGGYVQLWDIPIN